MKVQWQVKWRKRQTVEDQKTGPRDPRSTVLSEEEEAMIVAVQRHTLLPLDHCLQLGNVVGQFIRRDHVRFFN